MMPLAVISERIVFTLTYIMVHVSVCLCVNVHLTDNILPGSQVFNASLGKNWRYTLSPSINARALFTLDRNTGVIYLQEKASCSKLRENFLTINVIASSERQENIVYSNNLPNSTQLSLTFLFHGKDCLSNNHRKTERRKNFNGSSIKINVYTSNRCLPRNIPLISLKDLIPHSLRKCRKSLHLIDTQNFMYHKSSGKVMSVSDICSSEISQVWSLQAKCKHTGNTDIHLVIKLHSYFENTEEKFVFYDVSRRNNHHVRLKRQTSNTSPSFSQTTYYADVEEEENPGKHVTTITATDPDSGDAGRLTYSMTAIRDQRSNDMFAINPVSGAVNTTRRLDREVMSKHFFSVLAVDNARSEPRTAQAVLEITVRDINDKAPVFESNVSYQDISESIAVGSPVVTVKATDDDAGPNAEVRYFLINSGPPNDVFLIDPTEGTITTRSRLDRENIASYKLLIRATDQGPSSSRQSATATVNVRLIDENDNYPQFTKRTYHVNVSEDYNYSPNPVIIAVNATDLDEGINREINYAIFGGNTLETFSINRVTGAISIQRSLDYEQTQQFQLSVRAQDGGQPPLTNSTTVIVDILDVNDNDPQFYSSPHIGTVLESASINSTVLNVQARDADSGRNQELVYSIIDAPPNLPFFIVNGEIKVKSALDREQGSNYEFVVKAQDQGIPPRSATSQVQITVRDVNDNSPVFDPKFYNVTVAEDLQVSSRIISLTATDADSGDNAFITYSIRRGNANNVFRMTTANGEGLISLIRELDYKTQNVYILTVLAFDSGNLNDTATVQINVLDTNQHKPAFQGTPYTTYVDENIGIGTSIYKVLAIDQDVGENARVSYQILGNTDFQIDANTGEITTRIELDRETKLSYNFEVTAHDNGQPSLTATEMVTIFVQDVNDNSPEFTYPDSQDSFVGSIAEDARPAQSVLTVIATDRDKGPNALIRYRFLETTDPHYGDFDIDSASGVVRVAKGLDRETVAQYRYTAVATDGGVPPRSSSVLVTINIEDVNDNPPIFDDMVVKVAENTLIGSEIAQISAVDPDDGINAQIEYEKVGGRDMNSFDLDFTPGRPAILRNRIDLDFESLPNQYEVMIRAKSDPFFKDAKIYIQVQDINDNEPILKDFTIIFNNYVYKFISGPIGRVPATDPDEIDRDRLRYEIVAGNEASFIHLNHTTGELTLDYRLNSDVPRNGSVEIKVSDGKNEKKATCRLYVRLVTKEMLQNSVTIRLDNMTQSTFLSPLFKFFQDAMATILKTEEKNIYVISVKNDSEASSKVLNVTVAVSRSDGSFQPAEYVREQIYLQRILLANLSTLQVLPFDDNFCINEPCPAFKSCIIEPIFGQAANFISSDMMLFRPIHPKYQIQCTCPKGFAGYEQSYTCDVEIDMCYSGPCQNGGTCVRKEGAYTCICKNGFSGENCQYDNSSKFDSLSCPSGLCQYPSTCEPLPQTGFQCKGCPTGSEYNKFCQLTTRRFTKGSFLTFPALKKRNRFTVQMTFATQMKDGLLFYNGRFNERHDFIALEIINRQLRFSFSLGENITMVTSNVEGGVSNGEWQQVTVEYHNRTVTLSVGENCDTELNVRFGNLISDYQCASRVTNVLPEICFISLEETCYKLLDLTGPFQIGGLPKVPSTFQIYNKDFDGCIKDVYIDHEFLDLNKSVANVGTQPGCKEKKRACLSAPCTNGGTCIDVWDTFLCKCPARTGAKDCSQVIDEPIRVDGGGIQAYASSSLPSSTIMFPWYNGISVRTREREGVLMHISISTNQFVLMELHGGYVQYNYSGSNKVHTFDYLPVNDGQWHYLEVRWPRQGQIILVMDYGVWQSLETMSSTIENKQIDNVKVGAQRFGSGPIEKGFIGCIQNVRVGNSQAAILQRPAESINVYAGCDVEAACDSNTCPTGATCEDEWRKAKCLCPKGTLGPECKAICQTYNPCQNHAICHGPTYKPEQNWDYTCECGTLQSGRYCQNVAQQPCAKAWYGYPICGPCNCSRELGFDTECEKSNGACICQDFHYRPEGSDRCYPCDCYKYGTVNQDVTCHPITGQCQCKGNIIGRRCDQCDSQYAHISFNPDDTGCIITTNMCPRHFYKGIWWEATYYGKLVVQDCPNKAVGDAKRNCSQKTIWGEPDLFNCTNTAFVDLKSKIEEIENGTLKINSFVSKTSMRDLALALSTTSELFGSDINVTYRLISSVLEYENQQKGLNLTSEQDSTFIKNMLNALSIVLDVKYAREWSMINQVSGGTGHLLNQLETYLVVQTENMATLQNTPFSVVSKNIVLSLDMILPQNFSGVKIPKFDNIVHKPTFDDKTHVLLPKTLIESSVAQYIQQVMNVRDPPKAYVSFIMYNTLGHLLPRSYDDSVRVIASRPVVTNAPVFTLVVKDNDSIKHGGLAEPIKFHFKQQVSTNRTDPQCAFWKSAGSTGAWSTSGCAMDKWYEVIIKEPISNSDTDIIKEKYVVCSCDHMTSFTLLMDVADTEYVAKAAISLAIFSIIGIGISLGCLFVTFVIFMSFKHLQCNANSIMLNLIFTIFMSELAFIIGINRVEIKFICCLVAIALHFFYLSSFTWLFVEMLHLYRRLIEIREINYGAMKFYYLLGYVIPGIIVGLSVGLYTDGYGNSSFCWMDMSEPFIWSFAGPVAIAIPAIIFLFILALHASSKEKTHVSDISSFRIRIFCGIVLLLLLGVSWILGLVSVNFDIEALYYVYTAFSFAQGVFIFLAYVIGDKRVRFHVKKQWYKMQGKKLENQDGLSSRPSVSRSALAYRRDSIDGYINRTNVGISTTSTTSRSTSKSSGGLFKGEDYLRSTDTSTSGHVPSYTYDNTYNEKSSEMPEPGERRRKRRNRNDSDSESDVSVGDASLELASSHSSDEDDEFDIGPSWEKELPTNKKIEEAKEQARQKKREEKMKDVEQERNVQNLQNMQNNGLPSYGTVISQPNYGHWPGDPNLTNFHMSESDFQSSEQPVMSSVPPDVTLPAQEYKGMREYIMPPVRSDSLMNDSSTISNQTGPFNPVKETRMKVQVLTHNGSISSDTECSDETTV